VEGGGRCGGSEEVERLRGWETRVKRFIPSWKLHGRESAVMYDFISTTLTHPHPHTPTHTHTHPHPLPPTPPPPQPYNPPSPVLSIPDAVPECSGNNPDKDGGDEATEVSPNATK